jgi:aerobic carbon-monoxide dehydrogenase medium subunit
MKPAPFEIARPAGLLEAAALLASAPGAAKLMAGGQSLGPMLNLRLARPQLLVDISALPELRRVEAGQDHLTFGACVTTADIEDRRVGGEVPMLADVAGRIAYRAVRNRGTVGGSLCHADPAADWAAALSALGAEAVLSDGRHARSLPVAELMRGAFETTLSPAEILSAVRIPRPTPRARWGYYKVCRKVGEFALAIGVVYSDPERGAFRAVIGATGGAPLVVADARGLFSGAPLASDAQLDTAAAERLLGTAVRDGARRRLLITALSRAAEEARSK